MFWRWLENKERAGSWTIKFSIPNKKRGYEWSDWETANADFSPKETSKNMYWTDALFSYDATSQDFIEFEFSNTVTADEMQIDLFDGNYATKYFDTPKNEYKTVACPEFPSIITRNDWCGGSAPCSSVNTPYSVVNIVPTHVVIHHGGTPDTYTNGANIVRSYWNYHVNTLGWSDIGYNYLLDKEGNLYQGRYNPNMPTTDVRGAHAIHYNSKAIGVCFLGHSDFTISTSAQLNKLYSLLGWWFKYKGFDPTSSASILNTIRPRIMGHRDVGTTICPGNDLYSRLDTIRIKTKIVSDAVGCETLGISQYSKFNNSFMAISPNPNDGNFSLSFVSNRRSTISVSFYDQRGKIVHSQKGEVKKGENTILFNLKKKFVQGVYTLQIDQAGKRYSKKIIIEN
ncbi:N-acetylmuramoyl-L-alanine amidase [Chryseobacterium sp. 1B4]